MEGRRSTAQKEGGTWRVEHMPSLRRCVACNASHVLRVAARGRGAQATAEKGGQHVSVSLIEYHLHKSSRVAL